VPHSGLTTDPQAAPVAGAAGPAPAAGQRIGDRYVLRARLGGGATGAVWRAWDEKVEEELALKLLVAGDAATLRREVALARRIAHPGVCRVYDLGEADGHRFLTMERIEGQSLRRLLAAGPPPPGRAAALVDQLAAGAAAIHAAGVVHRDLKPENIVVTDAGRARINFFNSMWPSHCH
jgi:serine/threonine-protein kinase